MVLTPTITLTAMVSAATATEVRLSERVIARHAIVPSTPKTAPPTGSKRRIIHQQCRRREKSATDHDHEQSAKTKVEVRAWATAKAADRRD